MYKLHKYRIQSLYNIYKWLILNEIKNMLDFEVLCAIIKP